MITLIKGQPILANTNYIVYEGGNYNETDLVQVSHISDPDIPIYSYQAFYITKGYDYLTEQIPTQLFKIGYDNPEIINYDIMGYHKKRTIVFGELVKVEYYELYDGMSYSNLIVDETREYIRDKDTGIAKYRNQTSRWYLINDEIGLTKNTIKYYTIVEAIQEGVDRRSNIIDEAKSYVLLNIGQSYSFDLLTSVKNEIQYFQDGYTDALRNAISNSSKPYLNQLIKDGIIETLRLN